MSANHQSGAISFNRKQDILAHLVWSAAQATAITLTGPGFYVTGILVVESSEQNQLEQGERMLFLPDEDVQVRLGMPLKAEMFCGKDRYTFYTRIGSIFGETWFLELPYSIERADRRAATRIKVLGDPGYRMDITNKHHVTLMAVTDISYTGIGLLGDPAVTKLSIGDTLIGTLHLPTYSIAIQLDIQNIHPGNNNNGLHIYGCKIGKISDEDRRALIKLLLQLRPDAR